MTSLKSRLIKTTFSEIYPYKNGQKVLALGAIELNLTMVATKKLRDISRDFQGVLSPIFTGIS